MLPPYIRLFVKDFSFDTQNLTDKQLGSYVRKIILAYKTREIPPEFEKDSAFLEIKSSNEKYNAICKRNKMNRDKSKVYADQSLTSGPPVVDQTATTLVKPEPEPEPEPKRIYTVELPAWISPDTWEAFIEMRKKIKKPATEHAKKLLINNLNKLMVKGYDPNKIIETSIMNCWQGFFEPKEKPKSKHVVM